MGEGWDDGVAGRLARVPGAQTRLYTQFMGEGWDERSARAIRPFAIPPQILINSQKSASGGARAAVAGDSHSSLLSLLSEIAGIYIPE